jgi:hypothetical protein
MPTLHVVITKSCTFRGKPERFSNGYTLQSTSPFTSAYVKSVADALVAMERTFTGPGVTFPYRVGGPLGEDAVYAEEVASPPSGSASFAGVGVHPETCALAKSRIGPKRYAFKYYHGALASGSFMSDVLGGVATNINAAIVQLTNGSLPGAASYCRPNGDLLTQPFVCDQYARVHQFKRRGKRTA